jgi:hypothetical protein
MRGIYRLTIMIGRCENLCIIGLIFGGKLNREVSHGGHCSTSGNHSHRGSYFLPCTTERLQTTEVKKASVPGLPKLSSRSIRSLGITIRPILLSTKNDTQIDRPELSIRKCLQKWDLANH